MDNKQICRPVFIDKNKYQSFKTEHPVVVEINALSRQIKELFFIDNNHFIGQNKDLVYKTEQFQTYVLSKEADYQYIYFPWNQHVVKTILAADYLRLKTNRNQDLITREEQKKLATYKVAVLGMSVGSNIALVLTQAGISNTITLADFDELDTTNLNRIIAGIHQVGINKAIVAARHIYEDNPFAEVVVWSDGANVDKLEQSLKNGEIQCIVEEVDDIKFKIKTRILAKKYKVPVVMVTDNGDGVVLHVERFDLGYDKIWGKEISYFETKLASGDITKEKVGEIIMFDIVGGPDRVDPRMLTSVKRVLEKELVSWSQLGSAAILGGVVATHIIKKIILGESSDPDIRSYISPHDIVHSNHSS